MKPSANQRLGILLIVAILALIALCVAISRRGSAVVAAAPHVDTVVVQLATPKPSPSPSSRARKSGGATPAPPEQRQPLDETF